MILHGPLHLGVSLAEILLAAELNGKVQHITVSFTETFTGNHPLVSHGPPGPGSPCILRVCFEECNPKTKRFYISKKISISSDGYEGTFLRPKTTKEHSGFVYGFPDITNEYSFKKRRLLDLWEEASKFPLHGMLHDSSSYVFACITSMAENEELLDETRRLCDVRPFCSILRVIERKGDTVEQTLNTQISNLIGKGLHEFDSLKNTEVNDFRWKMKMLGDEVARGRQTKSWIEKVIYQFPPRLAKSSDLPQSVMTRLRDGNFVLMTKFENTETSFTFNISYTMTPLQLLRIILNKKTIMLNSQGERPEDFVLKVCGREEYFVGDYPIIQYLYIQETLLSDGVPTLVTVSCEGVPVDVPTLRENSDDSDMKRTRSSFSTLTLRKKGKHMSSWNILEPFTFRVCAISRLNCDVNRTVEVGVHAGLFHGGKSLSESQKTTEKQVSKEGSCEWEEDLTFDLKVCNIPRMARLCLVVYEISKTAKGVKSRRLKDTKQCCYLYSDVITEKQSAVDSQPYSSTKKSVYSPDLMKLSVSDGYILLCLTVQSALVSFLRTCTSHSNHPPYCLDHPHSPCSLSRP
uniref:C2 domain-containing protein n=1 Tax=Timema poppense TaxID=170557 RepID=A0A7R9CSE2_TIMPO|nr:unnamed protein product [Timema poppensis]